MKQTVLFFILIASIIACNNEKTANADETTANNSTTPPPVAVLPFDKLVGLWKNEDGKSFERWTRVDNGQFRMAAFSIKGNDTSWHEKASIYPESDKWVFENTVTNQNDGRAIKFISSIMSGNSVQFSNPAHDFPTDINYTIPDSNTVRAFIVGPNAKGGKDTIPFNFVRVW